MRTTEPPWTACSTGTLSKYMRTTEPLWTASVLANYPGTWEKLCLYELLQYWHIIQVHEKNCASMNCFSTGTLSRYMRKTGPPWTASVLAHYPGTWEKLCLHELFAVLAHYPSTWVKLSLHELFQY
jgi:hypothetical protein